MGRQNVRIVLVATVMAILPIAPVRAAGWADGLFAERKHEFGLLARGAKARHSFVLTNGLAEPITILDLPRFLRMYQRTCQRLRRCTGRVGRDRGRNGYPELRGAEAHLAVCRPW